MLLKYEDQDDPDVEAMISEIRNVQDDYRSNNADGHVCDEFAKVMNS